MANEPHNTALDDLAPAIALLAPLMTSMKAESGPGYEQYTFELPVSAFKSIPKPRTPINPDFMPNRPQGAELILRYSHGTKKTKVSFVLNIRLLNDIKHTVRTFYPRHVSSRNFYHHFFKLMNIQVSPPSKGHPDPSGQTPTLSGLHGGQADMSRFLKANIKTFLDPALAILAPIATLTKQESENDCEKIYFTLPLSALIPLKKFQNYILSKISLEKPKLALLLLKYIKIKHKPYVFIYLNLHYKTGDDLFIKGLKNAIPASIHDNEIAKGFYIGLFRKMGLKLPKNKVKTSNSVSPHSITPITITRPSTATPPKEPPMPLHMPVPPDKPLVHITSSSFSLADMDSSQLAPLDADISESLLSIIAQIPPFRARAVLDTQAFRFVFKKAG
ncbi:MAG: hypothetical protein LBG06_10110, partial [Deltaproteobacteria bacterium]|nr:hypothetical protein [Deltaproteobacteria bacterium]